MPTKRQAPDDGRLAVIQAFMDEPPDSRPDYDLLYDHLPYLLALARRQAEALRWVEANRTGPCLFCYAEPFRPHVADCELGKLLAEVEP
jgi:hypothetical protein